MKKLIAVLAIIGAMTSTIYANECNYYADTTLVIYVNRNNDTVSCINWNGKIWKFTGCEDWEVGDIASLVINDNNTADVYDDVVVNAKYSGWLF